MKISFLHEKRHRFSRPNCSPFWVFLSLLGFFRRRNNSISSPFWVEFPPPPIHNWSFLLLFSFSFSFFRSLYRNNSFIFFVDFLGRRSKVKLFGWASGRWEIFISFIFWANSKRVKFHSNLEYEHYIYLFQFAIIIRMFVFDEK